MAADSCDITVKFNLFLRKLIHYVNLFQNMYIIFLTDTSQDCQGCQEDAETQGYQDGMDRLELEVLKASVAHQVYQH
jgi:hypothetical protein